MKYIFIAIFIIVSNISYAADDEKIKHTNVNLNKPIEVRTVLVPSHAAQKHIVKMAKEGWIVICEFLSPKGRCDDRRCMLVKVFYFIHFCVGENP